MHNKTPGKMLPTLFKYSRLASKILTADRQAMTEAADDPGCSIPAGALLTCGIAIGSFIQYYVQDLDWARAISFNLIAVLLFFSAAMLWDGAGGLIRFFRVFGLASLLDFLLLPFMFGGEKLYLGASAAYQLWTIIIYSFIYAAVYRFSLLKGVLTVLVINLLLLFIIVMLGGDLNPPPIPENRTMESLLLGRASFHNL